MWGQICKEAAENNWEHRGSSPLPEAPPALPGGDGCVGQWLSGLCPVGACCPHHSWLYGLGGGWCALSEVAVAELELGKLQPGRLSCWGWGWQQGGGGHGFMPRASTASVLVAQ